MWLRLGCPSIWIISIHEGVLVVIRHWLKSQAVIPKLLVIRCRAGLQRTRHSVLRLWSQLLGTTYENHSIVDSAYRLAPRVRKVSIARNGFKWAMSPGVRLFVSTPLATSTSILADLKILGLTGITYLLL
jgi:hypothetical protein